MSYGGAAAAALAAQKAKQIAEHEEEKLTTYNSDDMDKWEFKIVRSPWGSFRNKETIQKVCKEEAKAGWEMLEKFDNNRIRFKRRTEKRSSDSFLAADPYRTTIGSSSGTMAAVMMGIVFLILGVIALIFFVSGGYVEITNPVPIIMTVGLLLLVVAIVVKKRTRK